MSDRRGQIAAAVTTFQQRLAEVCAETGRNPDDITVVAVTKTFPASDVELLAELGITDVGENRDAEARTKVAEVAARWPALRWHFVGQVQRNKAASIATYADVVQSVDRVPLVTALDNGATAAGRQLDVLIQVNLDSDADPGRGGIAPDNVLGLAQTIGESQSLRLRGVMAVAPLAAPAEEAFTTLAEVSAGVVAVHSGATWISAGMSGDWEKAVAAGATHLRIGAGLLGKRTLPGVLLAR